MVSARELQGEIDGIIREALNSRDGQVVPTPSAVALSGGAVKLNATMLYTDLADSTKLAMYDRVIAARVFKAFLACSTRLIRENGGEIRSFDGDRVLGVFLGKLKNTSAVKCALQINWMFLDLLKPKFAAQYAILQNGTHGLSHCTGIDTGEVLVVRSGIRNNNDLIWVGGPPNIAAKLSAIRDTPYHSFIAGSVYDQIADEVKVTPQGQNLWEERVWNGGPISRVFRSHYKWPLA